MSCERAFGALRVVVIPAAALVVSQLAGCATPTTVTYTDYGTAVLCQAPLLSRGPFRWVLNKSATCDLNADVLDQLTKTRSVNTILLLSAPVDLLGAVFVATSATGLTYQGNIADCLPPNVLVPSKQKARPSYGEVTRAHIDLKPREFVSLESVPKLGKSFAQLTKISADINVDDMEELQLDESAVQDAIRDQRADISTKCRAVLRTGGYLVTDAFAVTEISYTFHSGDGPLNLTKESVADYVETAPNTKYRFDINGRLVKHSPTYVAIAGTIVLEGEARTSPENREPLDVILTYYCKTVGMCKR